MSAPRYASFAAKLLGKPETHVPAPSAESRARAIAHIELALERKAERKGRRKLIAATVAVAAAFIAVWFGHAKRTVPNAVASVSVPVTATLQPTGSGARLLTASGSEALQPGSSLPIGARLLAEEDGGASLRLSTGTEIAVEHGANLTFSSAGATEQFELAAGSMRAHVSKLAIAQRFIVRTPDAEVEVRGTIFRVSVVEPDVRCGAGAKTRVDVTEGIVEVRSGHGTTLVHPGEAWPAGCASPAVSTANDARVSGGHATPHLALRAPARAASESASAAGSRAEGPASSSLAEQNDLFAAAVAARRTGNSALALSKLGMLSARFPGSALSEAVAAERLRALTHTNHAEARAAARDYLTQYPQGFARTEAEAILATP